MRSIATTIFVLPLLATASLALGPAQVKPAVDRRANARISAYAPPTVPHQLFGIACLDCHATSDLGAPMMPHQEITNCRQCHVLSHDVPLFRRNTFRRMPEPKPALKAAYAGAPPVVPHRVFMREKCLACHAPGAREATANTPHPERIHCLQCHVPQRWDVPLFRRNTNLPDTRPMWGEGGDLQPE